MIAQDYLKTYFGAEVRVDELPLNTTIQTTPTRIISNDATRGHFFVVNTGTHDLLILPSNLVSTTNGILIAANGGSIVFKVPDNGIYPTLEWYGVGNGGTTTITFGSTRFLS